jgi:hypothetical protein
MAAVSEEFDMITMAAMNRAMARRRVYEAQEMLRRLESVSCGWRSTQL